MSIDALEKKKKLPCSLKHSLKLFCKRIQDLTRLVISTEEIPMKLTQFKLHAASHEQMLLAERHFTRIQH